MSGTAEATLPIATLQIRHEHDVVLARQRARRVAQLGGLDVQEQVRFATAVSELARNAYQYAGGGRLLLAVDREREHAVLMARVVDAGPGIADLEQVLAGRYTSTTGMGLGLLGARRLCDRFAITSEPGRGTDVRVGKVLAHEAANADTVRRIADALARDAAESPYEELQRQNQELLTALDGLRESATVVERLNSELADTNRGVVALYAELDERAEEMRRMSETKTRFLSDMSHELRTPLTSIINLARLLLGHVDGPLNDEQETQVQLIARSAESLADMVNDLLDIAKIESGRVDLRIETFKVQELLTALRGMFRPIVTGDRVRLVIEEPSSPITMRTDEQRLAQALRNFVSNALKFTSDGEVRVAAAEEGELVRFTVSDTGGGIAPADLDRIFEEFVQVDGPIQRRVKGTGLGLPLTRKLAVLLGGTVTAESTVGQGSRFTLRVPRELPRESAHQPRHELPDAGGRDG